MTSKPTTAHPVAAAVQNLTAVTAGAFPRKPAAPLDLIALAKGAVAVKAMPKVRRAPSGTQAIADLVDLSYTSKKPYELPPVPVPAGKTPEKVAATLVAAVRRGAALADLGVTIGWETTGDGHVVVTLFGRRKRVS